MNMVERVGRALAKEERYAYDPYPYDERARVAIEAMMEPTDQMVIEGSKANVGHGFSSAIKWKAIIRAALEEKPNEMD